MKLYEITEEVLGAIETLESLDIPEQEKADSMSALISEWSDKAGNVIAYIKNLDAEADAYSQEASRLSSMAKQSESKADRLRDYLRHHMAATGITEIKGGVHSAKTKKPPKVVVIDILSDIPRGYCKYNPESWTPNKKALSNALKNGEDVPGCHLADGKTVLTIK